MKTKTFPFWCDFSLLYSKKTIKVANESRDWQSWFYYLSSFRKNGNSVPKAHRHGFHFLDGLQDKRWKLEMTTSKNKGLFPFNCAILWLCHYGIRILSIEKIRIAPFRAVLAWWEKIKWCFSNMFARTKRSKSKAPEQPDGNKQGWSNSERYSYIIFPIFWKALRYVTSSGFWKLGRHKLNEKGFPYDTESNGWSRERSSYWFLQTWQSLLLICLGIFTSPH